MPLTRIKQLSRETLTLLCLYILPECTSKVMLYVRAWIVWLVVRPSVYMCYRTVQLFYAVTVTFILKSKHFLMKTAKFESTAQVYIYIYIYIYFCTVYLKTLSVNQTKALNGRMTNMNSKGYERKRSWTNLPRGTEESHETPQTRQRFEPGTFRIRRNGVNHSAATFGDSKGDKWNFNK
jgi:hypothetical protein